MRKANLGSLVVAMALGLATMLASCGDDDCPTDACPEVTCETGTDADADADADADGDVPDVEPDVQPDVEPDVEPDAVLDDGGVDDGTLDDGSSEDGTGPDVEWEPCPLFPDGSSMRMAECAVIDLPLDADDPSGPTVGIWVQRLRGTHPTRKGQVWLLEGGPGGSGSDFASYMDQYSGLDPRWDWYTLDHRGVGLSDRLGCPVEEDLASENGLEVTPSEWDACLAHLDATWGDDLAHYTATSAGRDLGALIDLLREPGLDVFVYGVSYGSYWAIRYLELFPDQATGVILDSIAPPGILFSEFDVYHDDVGERFVRMCGSDPTCAAKIGPDPWATVTRVFEAVAGGSCAELSALLPVPGMEAALLRTLLTTLLQNWDLRPFIPAVMYRLDRCDPGDAAAVLQLLGILFPGVPTAYELRGSQVVGLHVGLSELWPDPPPDPAALEAILEGVYLGPGIGPAFAALQDRWPTYERDAYCDAWPTTSLPILMLNGSLDPQTPIWLTRPAGDHFHGPNQYFYELPRTPHCVMCQSYAATLSGLTCGQDIMFQFLDNPEAEPDASCVGDIYPINFAGNPEHSMFLFGTPDMWENGTKAGGAPVRAVEPRGLAEARRWARVHWATALGR